MPVSQAAGTSPHEPWSAAAAKVAGAAIGAGAGIAVTILGGAILGPLVLPVAGGVVGALATKSLGL
jgi:hypothetical protein